MRTVVRWVEFWTLAHRVYMYLGMMTHTTQNTLNTLLSAMVARYRAGDVSGAERCYQEAVRRGVTQAQLDWAWAQE